MLSLRTFALLSLMATGCSPDPGDARPSDPEGPDLADDDEPILDDDDATTDDDDATSDEDGFIDPSAVLLRGELLVAEAVDGASLAGTVQTSYLADQALLCDRLFEHGGSLLLGADSFAGCPHCEGAIEQSGHHDVTPDGTCDVAPEHDIWQGGLLLDQMLGSRGVIALAVLIDQSLDSMPLGGAPSQTLGEVIATAEAQGLVVTHATVADLSQAGVPGDYSDSLTFDGLIANDGNYDGPGLSGPYITTAIYGFQLP